MKKFKILIVLVALILVSNQPSQASASTAADSFINGLSKGAYVVTKYTVKSIWFVAKKTAKGVKLVSLGIYNGSKDAFDNKKKPKKSSTTTVKRTLPKKSVTPDYDQLPVLPEDQLPVIEY